MKMTELITTNMHPFTLVRNKEDKHTDWMNEQTDRYLIHTFQKGKQFKLNYASMKTCKWKNANKDPDFATHLHSPNLQYRDFVISCISHGYEPKRVSPCQPESVVP